MILAICIMGLAGVAIAAPPANGHASEAASASAETPSPAPVPTVDTAAYQAKMKAIANLPAPSDCEKPKAKPPAKAAAKAGKKKGAKAAEAPAAAAKVAAAPVAEKKAPREGCSARRFWPALGATPQQGALLPFKRIVAYYGNFYSKRMGVLGEYPQDKVVAMLKDTSQAWAKADPSTPVISAIDYIAVSAQSVPGRDEKYRMRMPAAQIEKAISLGNQIHGLVFLDVQPGWSTVEAEVTRLAPYLKQPNVELALDPEFALVDGKRPGAWRGTMTAADINFAARFLARLVQENHLPPKILVVHRFTQQMVTDFRGIKPLPEVQIVMDMDGFGSPVLKVSTYQDYIATQPVQFTGFKLFYKNDVRIGHHLMSPSEILSLTPQPSYILYQ